MNLVSAGRYKAKILDHGITETKAGLPQAAIRFEFEAEGQRRELTWYGSFKEAAVEHTIKALVTCGLEGNDPSGPLEIGREVFITIEIDTNDRGDQRNVVRWVNPLGALKKIDPREASAKLERFRGAVMAYREKEGLPSGPKNFAPGSGKDPWDN